MLAPTNRELELIMADAHFISYSSADALDFALKLADALTAGPPSFPVWIDKRRLKPGQDYDVQLREAIRSCASLIFVMSRDSVEDLSVCREEWSRALSYKKPVTPILYHAGIEKPFGLGARQHIDFTGDFERGLAQLRRHLGWLDSPEGALHALKYRLADAVRDQRRASDLHDLQRITDEIALLKQQIAAQERTLADPEATAQIETGLERERQPERPVSGEAGTRISDPPSAVTPSGTKSVASPVAALPEARPSIALDSVTISSPIRLELVRIPAGEFPMGSDPKRDKQACEDEQPQLRVSLPEFYIGKYPVTNAQYAAFVEATGGPVPNRWEHGRIPEGKEEHPVVNVSWDNARAFCGWLSQATGQAFRLPAEAEWEKAARGMGDRIYPWGGTDPDRDSTLCNCDTRIGDTTSVGKYPNGASPCGALDMAGNVWEWTSSLYVGYPYDATDGREDPSRGGSRVLRGGSFDFKPGFVRCASRHWEDPKAVGDCIGFRVVAPVPFHPIA
jgi:formylglycine-generating enzyme required for sulfatase activity